jgi:hypothetical protein
MTRTDVAIAAIRDTTHSRKLKKGERGWRRFVRPMALS